MTEDFAAESRKAVNRAIELLESNDPLDALDYCNDVLRRNTDFYELMDLAVIAAIKGNRLDVALKQVDEVIARAGRTAERLVNKGIILRKLKITDAAIRCYCEALAVDPNFTDALYNLGNALQDIEQYEEAEKCYKKILGTQKTDIEAWNNLGRVYVELGQLDKARDCFEAAIRLKNDWPLAHWNLALVKLQQGNYLEGWAEYEWRWQVPGLVQQPEARSIPFWNGENIQSRKILVRSEQGFGDIIQFIRYAELLSEMGAFVFVEAPVEIAPLIKLAKGVSKVIYQDVEVNDCDYQVFLMNLPYVLRTTISTIPKNIPYFAIDEISENELLGPTLKKKIGLVWSGGESDKRRNMPVNFISRIVSRHRDVVFYSLQKTPVIPEELQRFGVIHLGNRVNNFLDTAKIVAQLDLVISVDTSVAHLAGALGKPVWVPLRYAGDWRYPRGMETSPWYPSMRLFWQEAPGDWSGVADNINKELLKFASSSSLNEFQARYGEARKHFELGLSYIKDNLFELAIGEFKKAISIDVEFYEARYNLALAMQNSGKLDEAIDQYREIIKIKPDFEDAYVNLAVALSEKGFLKESVECALNLLRRGICSSEAYNNLGNTLRKLDLYDEAIHCYKKALEIKPSNLETRINLANTLRESAKVDEAIREFEMILESDPDNAEAHWGLAMALLLSGDFRRGWQEYEWRWKRTLRPRVAIPPGEFWQGQNIQDKILLLFSEQGFGDTIHFVRFIGYLKGKVGKIFLRCQRELVDLLKSVDGVAAVFSNDDELPDYDYKASLMSLPYLLGLGDVGIQTPYISARQLASDILNKILLAKRDNMQLVVGITWSGNPEHLNDRKRSIPLELFEPILNRSDVLFLVLQKRVSDEDLKILSKNCRNFVELSRDLVNFTVTAGVIAHCDLVLSVDTAVAHLAGAMGKEAWTLLPFAPDWRWLCDGEFTSLYPGMRLFRQKKPGDWRGVISKVQQELDKIITLKTQSLERSTQKPGGYISVSYKNVLDTKISSAKQELSNGNLENAVNLCRSILETDPENSEALHLIGIALLNSGKAEESIQYLERAVRIGGWPDIMNMLAIAYKKAGKINDALRTLQYLLKVDPGYADGWYNLANIYQLNGEFISAEKCYKQAIELSPAISDYHYNLGCLYQSADRFDEARNEFKLTLELDPNHVSAMVNLGTVLMEQGEYKKAIELGQKSIQLAPDFVPGYVLLGNVYKTMHNLNLAKEYYTRAYCLDKQRVDVLLNLGVTTFDSGEHETGIQIMKEALELAPADPQCHWNLGLAFLTLGDYINGWKEYEWRWKLKDFSCLIKRYSKPLWDGSYAKDKCLLIWCEQGFGDVIQFSRFIPEAAKRFRLIYFMCPKPLVPVMQCFGDHVIVMEQDSVLPDYDYHVPLMSIPSVLGISYDTVPRKVPYLIAEPRNLILEESLLSSLLKIGLVWAGNPRQKNDVNRSIKFSEFLPLLDIREAEFYSLQVGPGSEQIKNFQLPFNFHDLGGSLKDFADTASAIQALDLVISVDTSVAHLAGALGKNVWLVLGSVYDWRWGGPQERFSYWYPTMRIFRRQPDQPWNQLIMTVKGELMNLIRDRRELNSSTQVRGRCL